MSFLRGIFSCTILMILTAACGNHGVYPGVNLPAEGSGYTKYELEAPLACSPEVNIVDLHGDSSREYRGCNPQNAGTVKLYPAQGQSETVCVFPSMNGTPLRNGSIPVSKCGTLSSSGNSISFAGLGFNGIYVVRYEKYSAMAACLNTNYPAACASSSQFTFSYGILK